MVISPIHHDHQINQPKASPELLVVSPLQRAKRTAETLFDNEVVESQWESHGKPMGNPWKILGTLEENLGNILGKRNRDIHYKYRFEWET